MTKKNIKTNKITFRGREIEYLLERKSVKNVNLRVRPDGEVYVSANRRVSEKYIEKILMEKGDFILAALERYARLAAEVPCVRSDVAVVFGRGCRIRVVSGARNRAELSDGELVLTMNCDDEDVKWRLIEGLLRDACRQTVTALCHEEYPRFRELGVEFPEIKFRKMKSRWGSCQPKKGILTFNYELAAVPLECVRYVVLHELTHFLHPDHSAAFHRRLASFMPDAEARRHELEAYGVRLKIEK